MSLSLDEPPNKIVMDENYDLMWHEPPDKRLRFSAVSLHGQGKADCRDLTHEMFNIPTAD